MAGTGQANGGASGAMSPLEAIYKALTHRDAVIVLESDLGLRLPGWKLHHLDYTSPCIGCKIAHEGREAQSLLPGQPPALNVDGTTHTAAHRVPRDNAKAEELLTHPAGAGHPPTRSRNMTWVSFT